MVSWGKGDIYRKSSGGRGIGRYEGNVQRVGGGGGLIRDDHHRAGLCYVQQRAGNVYLVVREWRRTRCLGGGVGGILINQLDSDKYHQAYMHVRFGERLLCWVGGGGERGQQRTRDLDHIPQYTVRTGQGDWGSGISHETGKYQEWNPTGEKYDREDLHAAYIRLVRMVNIYGGPI